MHAAVVTSFDSVSAFREFRAPVPAAPTDMLIDVLAAGLHPRMRSQADGSHYTSTAELPLVPGVDGVGRGADGLRIVRGRDPRCAAPRCGGGGARHGRPSAGGVHALTGLAERQALTPVDDVILSDSSQP